MSSPRKKMVAQRRYTVLHNYGVRTMASIENRSRFQVSVKNRSELTKTFAHTSKSKAEEYCQSLASQKLKPKLTRLDDTFIVRIRSQGCDEQILRAKSLEEAKLFKAKLKVEHAQGLFINYAKAQSTTLADLLIRYLWEEAPRNKSFEVEAYKINAMLQDAGVPRQSIAEIVAKHKNPCEKVRNMKIRKESGARVRAAACTAVRFIQKPFAALVPEDFDEYVDERCQEVAPATVDRELDILSAVCSTAIKKWRIHVLQNPMDGVTRPEYFNERDRRLKGDEEERLLIAASQEDERISRAAQLDILVDDELQQSTDAPTRYRRRLTRRSNQQAAEATYVHVPWYETFVQFQLMTGARRSESLDLLWSNVDLEGRTAYLPVTKNGRPRKLPLRQELIDMLADLPRTSERVFDITSDGLRKAWARICKRAGLVGEHDLLVHDLRHEAISRVAEAGSNLPGGFSLIDLQHFSGHRDVRMLLRYSHLCTRALAQRLDAAFKTKPDGTESGFVVHHGRKRLKKESGVTLSDIVNDSAASLPGHSEPETVVALPRVEAVASPASANILHVDFSRKRA